MDVAERVRIILSKGYLPKELPPTFTSTDFGNHSQSIIKDWINRGVVVTKRPAKYRGLHKSGSYVYKIENTEAESLSTPKRNFERRNLHIVHPVPQAFLTRELCANWRQVLKWLARQRYTVDRVSVSDKAPRGIADINFEAHRAKKKFIEATADWLVRTDITRYYPSIYTHSIPWAAYGKARVKADINLYAGSLADRIDQLLRACNRNQTVGIPIGPETSRIVAEIISSRIDQEFSEFHHRLTNPQVDRLQDDWFIGCISLEQAELSLSGIVKSYREFSLEINGGKTSIDRIAVVSEHQWVSELGSFLSHGRGVPRGRRLTEFLELCLRMQVANPAQPVTNYALSVIENHSIAKADASFVESFLLRVISLSPTSMNVIARVMINLHNQTGGLSIPRIGERLHSELIRHLANGNHYESLWLLYLMRGLSIKVDYGTIKKYINPHNGSVMALVILDMDERKLVRGRIPKNEWSNMITREAVLTSGLWLLGYEGIRNGWLTDTYNLAGTDLFQPLLSRNVVFYDKARNVPKSSTVVKQKRRERAIFRRATIQLIQSLRGFEGEPY